MRFVVLCVALWALPAAISGNTYHVPGDYPLVQSAIGASAGNDTIVCDTVKDLDTIKITDKAGLVIKGPSSINPIQIAKVLTIKNSSCVLEMLSFIGAKGLDGTNNNSCKSAPGLDGRAGGDAIIIDSSTVTVSGCTVKGGDGGTYGVSYQGAMLCTCGSKGTPGSALRAMYSNISLRSDSLLSGYCAGTALAGCFTNNCAEQGFGCVGLNHCVIDTINSRINSIRLDSTSIMDMATKMVKGRILASSAAMRQDNFVSVSGIVAIPVGLRTPYTIHVYDAKGKLVLRRNNVLTKRFNLGGRLARNVYIISLQSSENGLKEPGFAKE